MQVCPDQRVLEALVRMIEPRAATPAIGVFLVRSGSCRFVAGAGTIAAVWSGSGHSVDASPWHALPEPVLAALAIGGAVRIDPAALGLGLAFAALHPVGAPDLTLTGFLLVADHRPRRLGRAMCLAIADGAALLAPLLRTALKPTPASRAREPLPLRGSIVSRATAHRLIETALKAREASEIAVMMLDLDRFRAVNDALGVAAGDALLEATGARIEASLAAGDRLVRLEGDRFVILAGCRKSDVRSHARKILDAVRQPLPLAGHSIAVQASMGIVAGIGGQQPPATSLMQADSALRRAKAEGGNCFVLHEPRLEAALHDKSQLELDLANAPANGQLHLVYQPYVDLETGEISGVEALMRWRHPDRGEIQPATFIPLAESSGLILALGSWTLHTALARAAAWPVQLALAVNISALQFHQPGFVEAVDAAIAVTGFPPERLELEITETVLMRDNPETARQLRALIARGIRIALDDFGTGYSALAYLARLPHHRIKLDRSFVQDLRNPATAGLIGAIIALARKNGVSITAEGVERPDQLRLVRAFGFTHAQGFAIGAPVADPAAVLTERLAAPA